MIDFDSPFRFPRGKTGGGWGSPAAKNGDALPETNLALPDARLPLLQFLGGPPLVPAEFGEQRDYPGVDAGHQPICSSPLPSRTSNPLAPPGTSTMSAPR